MFDPRDYITTISKLYCIGASMHGLSLYYGQTDTRCEIIKKICKEVPFPAWTFM